MFKIVYLPDDFYVSSRFLKNFSNPLGGFFSEFSSHGINLYINVGALDTLLLSIFISASSTLT